MSQIGLNPLIVKRILKMALLFILNMFISLPIGFMLMAKTMQEQLIWVVVYFVYYFFVLGLAWRFYKQEVPTPGIRFRLRDHKLAIFFGFLILVGIIFLNGGMQALSNIVYHTTQSANQSAIRDMVHLAHGNWISIVTIVVWLVLMAPVVEEVIYRGVLPNIYATGIFTTAIINGIMFGLNHGLSNIFMFSVYAILGIVLYLISRHYQSLLPNIMLHAANNAIGVIGLLATMFLMK